MAADGSVIIDILGDDSQLKSMLGKLGSITSAAMKGIAVAAGAASVAVVALAKQAVSAYADYEQLIGGVETLFKDSASIVEEYANNAYKTAGISANAYMETVTSFSASLLQSLGGDTEAVAKSADMAITDMADNANKMGTSMESIQMAYQGFAKQNYTMLDNLKLGYGGTKTEMERLLADAEKLSGQKYDISNLNDVYEAVHVVQTELGITGTTAKESSTTIQGSAASMKSAWENLLVGMADDTQDFDGLLENLIDSVGTFAENLVPRVEIVLGGIAQLTEKLMPQIAASLPNLASDLLPEIAEIGVSIVENLLTGITSNLPQLANSAFSIIKTLANGIATLLPQLAQTGTNLILQLAQSITQSAPTMGPKAVEVISELIQGIVGNLDQILSAGIDVLVALGEGIIAALPQLIEQVPLIVISICDAINNNATKLLGAALKLIVELGVGLVKAIPTLIKNIPIIIEAIVKAFFAFQWLSVGKTIIGGIANGIKGMAGSAKSAAAEISSTIGKHFSQLPGKLLEVGKNAVKGLVNGIKAGTKWAVSAVKELGANVLTGITGFFGIHSPSTLMRDEVGKNLVLGMADGIKKNQSVAERAMKELSESILDATTKFIEKKKFYNQLSANDEIEILQNLLQKEGLLADEREQVERNLYTAKKTLAEEQQRLYADYQNDLDSRTNALEGFAGIFDSVAEKSKISGRELLQNLRGQVEAFKGWQDDIAELSSRGISDALLAELQEMGPKAAGEIHALRQLTEEQLKEYNDLFAEKAGLAADQALKEVGGFHVPITLSYDETNVATNTQAVLQATTAAVDGMVKGVQAQLPKVSDITAQLAQCFVDTAASFQGRYYDVGGQMVRGLLSGIQAGRSGLINGIVSMLEAAVRAAEMAMDIHSPSRVWAGIGSNMAAGLGVGFVNQMRQVSAMTTQAMQSETAKMSAMGTVTAAKMAAGENAAGRVETYYRDSVIEKIPIIEFKGDLAGLGRALEPHIRVEEKRQGGNLVKGKGPNV